MHKLTASEKLRRRLNEAFKAQGHGSRSHFLMFSKHRPRGRKISAQNLSYFLNGHRENPIVLDDLADFAAYFHVSICDLFDDDVPLVVAKNGERAHHSKD